MNMALLEGQTPNSRRILGIPVKGNPTAETPNLNYDQGNNEFMWTATSAGAINFSDLIGEIAANQIPEKFIEGSKLVDETITEDQLATNAVTTVKLLDKSVTLDKLGTGEEVLNNGEVLIWELANTRFVRGVLVDILGSLPLSRLLQTGATDGQVMTWNQAGGTWIPQTPTPGTGGNFDLEIDSINRNESRSYNPGSTLQRRGTLPNSSSVLSLVVAISDLVRKIIVVGIVVASPDNATVNFNVEVIENDSTTLGIIPGTNGVLPINAIGTFSGSDPTVGNTSFSLDYLDGGTVNFRSAHLRVILVTDAGIEVIEKSINAKLAKKKTGPKKATKKKAKK